LGDEKINRRSAKVKAEADLYFPDFKKWVKQSLSEYSLGAAVEALDALYSAAEADCCFISCRRIT
jgi:hypothetical protein